MPYDRWGRTPEQARRDGVADWLFIATLFAIVIGCLFWGVAQ